MCTGSGVYTSSYTITLGVGSYPVLASLIPNGQLFTGSSGNGTLTVLPPQTITFSSIPSGAAGTPVALIASATSNLPR